MAFEVPTPEGSGTPTETNVQQLNKKTVAQTPSKPATPPSNDPLDNVDVPTQNQQNTTSKDPLDNVDVTDTNQKQDPLDNVSTDTSTKPKITSLNQSFQLKRTDTGGYQAIPGDDAEWIRPSPSTWNFNVNPDLLRTYSVDYDEAVKMLKSNKVVPFSNLDEGHRNILRTQVLADERAPMPEQNMNVSAPTVPVKDLMDKLQKSDQDFWTGINGEVNGVSAPTIDQIKNTPVAVPSGYNTMDDKSKKLLVVGQRYNVPGTTGKGFIPGVKVWDGESFRPIPEGESASQSPKVLSSVLDEFKGQPTIAAEQVSSRLQDIRNENKYNILVSGGYAPSIDTRLPKDVQSFLKSDEYLNATPDDKKFYAKELYLANAQQLNGMKPEDFYQLLAPTFTPSLNGTLIRQSAIEQVDNAQKVLSSVPKKQDPHSGLVYPDVDNPNYQLAKKSIDNLQKIIDDDPSNSESMKIVNALAQNVGGVDPVINPLIDASDAIDLHRIVNKVKSSGEESLTPGEKILFDSQSMLNSYQNISRPDVMTQAIGSIPSAVGFMLSLGATRGLTEASTELLGWYLQKGMQAVTPNMIKSLSGTLDAMKDFVPSLQKITDYSLGVGSNLASGTADVTVQTMIARNAAVLQGAMSDLTGNPSSSFSYQNSLQTTQINPPSSDGAPVSLLKRALMEEVNLASFKLAGKLTSFQDAALLRLIDKYPEADKWLNYLYTQRMFDSMQKMGIKIKNPISIGSIIRKLDAPSIPAEFVAMGIIPNRINSLIRGDKSDELMSNFPAQIKKDLVGFSGIALVSGLGRITSIGQSIWLSKVTYSNEFRIMNFIDKVLKPSNIEFQDPQYLDKLNKEWQSLSMSTSKKNVVAAQTMKAYVDIRLAFDNNEIDGVDKEKTPDCNSYMEQCASEQTLMNKVTDDIKNASLNKQDLIDGISKAPDDGWKQQFQFLFDMSNVYSSSPQKETLKQFIDKYKKEYQAIKDDLLVTDMMKTAPNWPAYIERINALPLPKTYKDECISILDNVHTKWKDERDKHIISIEKRGQPVQFVVNELNSHLFILDINGKYKVTSNEIDSLVPDTLTSISTMSNGMLGEMFEVVNNSELNPEQKKKINEAIKERLLKSFKDTEFIEQIGGQSNFIQLVSLANDLQSLVPFTTDEKNALTASIGHILCNQVKLDFSKENFDNIKSILQTCMQYLNVFSPADIMDLTKFIYKESTKQTVNNASNDAIVEMASTGDKDAIEELEFRKRNNFLNEEQKKLALEMLKGKNIKVGKDFNTLSSTNKYVKRLDQKLQDLVAQGRISENERFVLQGIISLHPIQHLRFNRIELQKTTDESAASYYNPASKGLVIQYTDNTPSWKIVGEIAHELPHVVHHNIASSLAQGGIGNGNFVMTDEEITEIANSNRADVVANIARWYRGMDYSYENYLRLYQLGTKRSPSERLEYDKIVNMLDWYREHFNQADRNNMDFQDDINKELKWRFNTELVVKNFNRWTEMRKAGYSPARAHYFSMYAHESFAELNSNSNVVLASQRVAADNSISKLVDNINNWTSQNIKVPILQRLYRSTIFDALDAKKYLNSIISQRDIDNMMKVTQTPDECINPTIKNELDNIADNVIGSNRDKGIPPLSELREQYRKIIEQGNPQLVEDMYAHILTTVKNLGYDDSILNDLIGQINKDAGLISMQIVEPTVMRHADTDEVDNELNDSPKEPLNEAGKLQAQEYGQLFLEEGIELILCSDMKRNQQTAKIAGKICGAKVIVNPLLKTLNTGIYTGLPESEFDEAYYVNNPDVKIPEGESFNEFLARCIEAKKIKDMPVGTTAIIANSKMMAVWDALDANAQEWNDEAKKMFLERENNDDITNKIPDYDSENEERIQSGVGVGENSEQKESDKEPGGKTTKADRILQTSEKVDLKEHEKNIKDITEYLKENKLELPQMDIQAAASLMQEYQFDIKDAIEKVQFLNKLETGEKGGAPLWTGAFKNLHDLINNNNEVDKLNRIGTYAGLQGLNNLLDTNPTLYKQLKKNLDQWQRLGATNSMENFLKYGFFMETLGKKFLKFEISDKDMKINSDVLNEATDMTKNGGTFNIPIGDFITHKKLFEVYPFLRNKRITFYNNPKSNEFGMAEKNGIGINLAHKDDERFDIGALAIHEFQHIAQDYEGWWAGGNPEMFKEKLFLYNTYLLYKSGDPQVKKIINSNDYHEIRTALGDISNGVEPKAKDEMFLDTRYSELMNHVTSTPEYKFAHAIYESLVGEREATDAANRYSLPSLYKMEMPVTMALSMKPRQQAIPLIGSLRSDFEPKPVDTAWYAALFSDKDGKVSKDNVLKLLNDINDNFYKYGQSTKIAKQLASEHARSIIDMWKARLIQTETPKISKYDREELLRLLSTPIRKNILDYEKDINFIEGVMTDANYRTAFDEAKRQQRLANNRFARYSRDNINFYMAVRRLSSINVKMFDTPDAISDYTNLLSTRIENVNVDDFIKKSDELSKKYSEWLKQFNDQYKTSSDTSAKDSTPLEDAMMQMRRDLAKEQLAKMVNQGAGAVDKRFIDEFANIKTENLTNKEFEEYEEILHELLNNPTTVDHKLIQFVDKQKASDWYDKASLSLSKKYIDLLNDKAMPSDILDILKNNIRGSFIVPFPKLEREGLKVKITGWYDKLGNISSHNLSVIFDALEGFPKAQVGLLNSEIRQPLDAAYQAYLRGVSGATKDLSPVGKFRNASMHLIGMHGLLNQLPDFTVSGSTLEFLHDKGIDIDDIGKKSALSHSETDENLKKAYDLVNASSKDMIKDSILISFGLKPDGNWTDKEIEEILNDTAVMSRRSKAQIQKELDDILKDSGYADSGEPVQSGDSPVTGDEKVDMKVLDSKSKAMSKLIDDIISGEHQLTPEEKSYLDTIYKRLSEVRDGVHSSGITLKDAAEKFSGTDFFEIPNYFPMIRYKTYLTTKTYFDPNGEESNDAKIFHGIYSDFNMNTAFLTKRKPSVMSINTNAYEAVRKRIDDQIFYLNHIDQQTYLYDIFRTPFFNGDGATFNTYLSNHITGFLNMYFNRGIDSERAEMYKSPTGREISKVMNNYRAFVLGNPINSFKILSSAVFSMSKLEGSALTRLGDMKDATGMMSNSYIQGTAEEKFLRENAPEVYSRGLATYDISTYENELHNTEGGILKDLFPGKVAGVLSGLEQGLYKTELGKLSVLKQELGNRESSFGPDASLMGIVWNHRIAARTAFFALYKNYCEQRNVPVDFENPNQDAVTFANEAVRATQNTDNPIQKTGLQAGLVPGDTRWWGQFNSLNMLAFKSFAINERSTLMVANERLVKALQEKDYSEAAQQAKYFGYSFMSKFLFNLIKLQGIRLTALAAAHIVSSGDDATDSYDRSIDSKSSLGVTAFKTILDYFLFNEVIKWGVSFTGQKVYEEYKKGQNEQLTTRDIKSLEYTRDPIDAETISGQVGDIIDNVTKGTQTVATDYNKYGLDNQTDADAAKMMIFMYSLGVNNIPGSTNVSDLIREIDSQRKANEKAAKDAEKNKNFNPLKGKKVETKNVKGINP